MSRRTPGVLSAGLRARCLFLCLLLLAGATSQAQVLRKIGEMDLYLRGIVAGVDPLEPVVPKNTPGGVRIVVKSGASELAAADVTRFAGGAFRIEGELSGPGLKAPLSLPYAGSENVSSDPLILVLPPVTIAGDYDLSNLRITVNGRTILDVIPRHITVKVIDQVLVTSVKTRPLTLDEIKDRGIVLDSNSYLGFEFTVGVQMDSKAVDVTFPVVFDKRGVAVPQPLDTPPSPGRAEVPLPTIVPMLLKPPDGPPPVFKDSGGNDVEVRIPSVLVIPGNVGYLKQFFSAQLMVANGAPGGSGLVVSGISGTVNLPPGADRVLGTADDPLSLPDKVDGPQPKTLPVVAPGPDGQYGTPDDVARFAPGEQGQAEFVIRGDQEGFSPLDFDIGATLEGLATGPVKVTGKASGGVLVRNPYFDLSFTVPAVARKGELFKAFVTVNNISKSLANGVTLTLDASRMSGAQLVSPATQTIDTLPARDSRTLEYTFRSDRTGQVVATYLKFNTQNGTTGDLKFTLAVGDRGVPLSPDTLVLPSAVDALPSDVVSAAMRVLGQAWSVANAPTGTLPADVRRTSKAVVTQKALALAEAGLRVQFGQPVLDAVRDLAFDFTYNSIGGSPLDAGFDQVLRQTEAGHAFALAVGNALRPAMQVSGDAKAYERATAQLAASGADFITFSLAGTPAKVTIEDAQGAVSTGGNGTALVNGDVASGVVLPLGGGDAGPMLGIIPSPFAGPYTLLLEPRAAGAIDLSFTQPNSSSSFKRAWITGFAVTPAAKYRVLISPQGDPAIETDADGDGAYESRQTLTTETLYPQGPNFISATVVGPETLAGASPFGFQIAMLFDRIVDAGRAATKTNYSIPSNSVISAKRQLSGRLVFATLLQPEGPYIPTRMTVSGMADLRGVTGPALTANMQSRLSDPGAVVSGRIINADGTGVSNAAVTYAQNPITDCAPPLDDYAGLTNVTTDSAGRYELRYVRQDACGMPFKIDTRDPNSGALREVSSSVRTAGEQIVLDIALFGRGSVTGIVRDLAGNRVAGADVFAISETDPQVSGTAVSDVSGIYHIDNITVGGVRVTASKGTAVGRGAGRIDRAGTTATVDLTLDGGAVSVAGTVRKVENGVVTVVPALQVVYYAQDGGTFVPVAVTTSGTNGEYSFAGMPTGGYRIEAALNTRDRGAVTGTAAAGDHIAGKDVFINVLTTGSGTVRGSVRLPDGTPAPGVVVAIDDRGVLSDASGNFVLPGVAVQPNVSRTVEARTRDGLRRGTTSVIVGSPNQLLDNVVVTLSGLGAIELTVTDAAKTPLANLDVALLGECDNSCGCATAKTGADGRVRFDGLPLGSVTARVTTSGIGFIDQAQTTLSIPRDGVTAFGVLTLAGAGTVTGTVLDPDGHPALGADVSLRAKVFDEESCLLSPGIAQRIRTGQNGTFRFTSVNVGSVAVTVTHPFFPTAVGAQGTLVKNGDTIDFQVRLTNTIAGELSGTVYLPDGTTPAGAGVEVTANGALPDVVVTTDANGKFAFAKILPAGGYSLTARDPLTGAVVRDQIFLQAGQAAQHDLRLKGRGTVVVRVVDGADQPVANAFVRLTETDFPNHVYEGVVEPATQGVVTFDNVFEGRLSAEAFDVFARGGRTSSVLPGPGATVTLKVALTVTGKVKGKFLRRDGVTPIPFGTVKLIAGGRVIGQATTDSGADAGSFAFDYVPAGQVRLEAQDPLTARTGIAAGAIASEGEELHLDVIAQGIGVVQGLVTSNGVAQPGTHVDVVSGSFHATMLADSAGRYRMDGVPEGLVVVTASIDGSFLSGTNSAPLAGEGTTINVDVALRGSGKVTAHVLKADGTPAPLAVVTAQVGGLGGGTVTASSDASGFVVFDRVPAGLASFAAEVPGSIDRGTTAADVAAGGTTDVIVRLNGVGTLSGRALDSAGQPVAGSVTINGTGAFPYTIALSVTNDGNFAVPEALAGPFTATLSSRSGEFTLYGTASGTIAPGATTSFTIQLQPSGTVTGQVFRADNTTPAYGATIVLYLDPNRGSVSLQAGSDGRFTARGVPLGAFTIRVDDALTGGIALVRGLTLANNGDTVDAGRLVLDDTPVAVVSVDPPSGATGIATNKPIVLTFSDALQSASGISVLNGTTGIGMAAVLAQDGKSVTLTGTLPDSADITVVAGTALTDIFGRHPAQAFTSTFRTIDLSPPRVASIVPANGAIQVAANAAIAVTFNEPLAASTNTATLITVNGVTGTTTATSQTVYTFTPSAPLANNALYSVTVNGAIDLSGNVQTAAFTSTFATADTVQPTIAASQPISSWVANARPVIAFTLSDAVSGIDTASGTMTLDGQPVTPAVTTSSIAHTPSAPLAEGSHSAQASIADRAGNRNSASMTFGIDTVPPSVATLSGIREGLTLKGTITVSGTATDNASGVASIQLLMDGAVIRTLAAPSLSGSLDTNSLAEGPHTFAARAVDVAGNLGPASADVHAVVDNRALAAIINSPQAGQRFRTSVTVNASATEQVSRIDFTLAGVTLSDSSAPYEVTFDLGSVADGTQTITVTAYGIVGDTATATRDVVVDRTPPAAPDASKISAEPPQDGRSLVFARPGATEGGASVEVKNTNNGAIANLTAAPDGSFSVYIASAIDDVLSITATDTVGNRGPSTLISVRRTPSLPPAQGSTSLRFEGLLVDRVSPTSGGAGLVPDGKLDGVFTMTINVGDGITRQLQYLDMNFSSRSTLPGKVIIGVAADPGGPLLNGPDGQISLPITGGTTLTLFVADTGFIKGETTYAVAAVFTDGSKFVGSCTIQEAADQTGVPHSATVTAAPATVMANATTPGTTTITVSNIRDIDGNLVPDGAKIALSAASSATINGWGGGNASAGGVITDGTPCANNTNFKVFTITGGQVLATYSSGSVVPNALDGALAMVQVIAADANGNTIGSEAIATIDVNIKSTADRAIISAQPTTLYGDRADRRSHLVINVRDANGNPVPDGTKVLIGAANCFSRSPANGFCYNSFGGSIVGGVQNRIFTVSGGKTEADFSSVGLLVGSGGVVTSLIQVLPADANGNATSDRAIGLFSLQIIGAAAAEIDLSPDTTPWVDPPAAPASVRVRHIHDIRSNLIPDDAKILISATSCASRFPSNGFCVDSSGGTITDGTPSPSGSFLKVFGLTFGEARATYSTLGVGAIGTNAEVTSKIQVLMADNTGASASDRVLGYASMRIVGALHALGSVDKPILFGDGALQTATVTFDHILDANGNPLPDGSKVTLSATSCAARFLSTGFCINSDGGQILEGTASPSGSFLKVFTITNGKVSATFGNQGITVGPGASRVSTVTMLPANAAGATLSDRALSMVSITSIGTTSGQGSFSPSTIHADGSDYRAMVTFTSFKDRDGRPVPDGTKVALSATSCAARAMATGFCINSDGGTILGGTTAPYASYEKIFTITNGQVVAEYSAAGVVSFGEKFGVVTVQAVDQNGNQLSDRAIAQASVRLVAPNTATLTTGQVDLSATGPSLTTTITGSDFKDLDPSIPVPDGSKVGISVINCASRDRSTGFCIGSIGGAITPAGTMPGDGSPAVGNSNFQLYTVKDGQIHATYSTNGINLNFAENQNATVQLIPADSTGHLLSDRAIATATIKLHGASSTTASGPATVARNGGTATIVFSGIKDTVGNVVPDGTVMVATAVSCGSRDPNTGFCINSSGGTITNGGTSSSGTGYRTFTVINGSVSVDYSPSGANATDPTARIQLTPANASGTRLTDRTLFGGIWTITLN